LLPHTVSDVVIAFVDIVDAKVIKNTFLTRHGKCKINSDHKNGS